MHDRHGVLEFQAVNQVSRAILYVDPPVEHHLAALHLVADDRPCVGEGCGGNGVGSDLAPLGSSRMSTPSRIWKK
jgi:hypothetical protein